MKSLHRTMAVLPALLLAISCSTTRVLPEGTYRLQKNVVEIMGDKAERGDVSVSDIEQYIKQAPNKYFVFGWNPFLNIYNWSNGKGNGWDRFVKKIGVAPVQFDPSLVGSSKENIESHLRYLGYYGSSVKDTVTYKKRRAKVKYEVYPGKRFPIKSICYDIGDSLMRSIALADSSRSLVGKGDYLSESVLESESQRLNTVYRRNGYYGFSKNYIFFEADTTAVKDSALLEIQIRNYPRGGQPSDSIEHRRYAIGNVRIKYDKDMKIRENLLKRLNLVKPGDIYDEQVINNTYSRFSGVRLFGSVNITTSEAPGNLVDCDISLTQSKIQGMKLNVEASTNSSGLFGISPSLSYYNKNIFRGGEWLTLSFMGNFQFKFNDPIRSNELGISAGISFPKFLFLPDRLFHGAIPRTDLNISYNYQSRPEYTRNIISTSFGYSWNSGNRLYYTLSPIQLNIIRLFNLDQDFYDDLSNNPYLQSAYQNHFDLGLGGTVYYTTDNSVNPKNTYFYTRLQFDLAGNVLSLFNPLMPVDENGSHRIWNTPYSQFARAELSLVRTWVFGKRGTHSLAVRAIGGIGYSYGNSAAMPFEKQFYAGGASSLRGWQSRAVGPGMSAMNSNFVIPNQTGDIKMEANIEYRFRIFWKIAGALFVDAGNVWNLRSSVADDPGVLRGRDFFRSVALNWGLGIRFDLDFVLLRLDMGIRLHDPSMQSLSDKELAAGAVPARRGWLGPDEWFRHNGFAIHFGVGYPF